MDCYICEKPYDDHRKIALANGVKLICPKEGGEVREYCPDCHTVFIDGGKPTHTLKRVKREDTHSTLYDYELECPYGRVTA